MARLGEEDLNISMAALMAKLAGGNPGATNVLLQAMAKEPLSFLTVDSKGLYDSEIWLLYSDVCGEDIDRFLYHLGVELPDQETGGLSVTGPWSSGLGDEWWKARTHGAENLRAGGLRRFWALENPPTERDYAYPISGR